MLIYCEKRKKKCFVCLVEHKQDLSLWNTKLFLKIEKMHLIFQLFYVEVFSLIFVVYLLLYLFRISSTRSLIFDPT